MAVGLHPDADRNTRGPHKLKRFEEFIEGVEQLVFGQTRRGEQAVAVFEEFDQRNRGRRRPFPRARAAEWPDFRSLRRAR